VVLRREWRHNYKSHLVSRHRPQTTPMAERVLATAAGYCGRRRMTDSTCYRHGCYVYIERWLGFSAVIWYAGLSTDKFCLLLLKYMNEPTCSHRLTITAKFKHELKSCQFLGGNIFSRPSFVRTAVHHVCQVQLVGYINIRPTDFS